jgi:hypothetical protein
MIDMAAGHQQPAHTRYPMGRIAVMGAGAVGCYYGFKLARAGHGGTRLFAPRRLEWRRLASYAAIRGDRQMKVGTRRSPAYASKVAGTAFGTARLVELALSADDALLFRSVRPLHHRGDGKAMCFYFISFFIVASKRLLG